MSEFHDAVSTLLEAFARGLSIIKGQKKRRSKTHASSKTAPEAHLSKSLKQNRRDVKEAYSRDLAQFGPGFAAGDVESRSALSSILSRLTTGFLSVIDRFTRGKSTTADYQALMSLSNSTRNETIHTFEQLSKRLSSSSLALAPSSKSSEQRNGSGSHKHRTRRTQVRHTRAKSAPDLSITPLGPASSSGWVRPKPKKRHSTTTKPRTKSLSSLAPNTQPPPPGAPSPPKAICPAPSSNHASSQPNPLPQRQTQNRRSIMSFASDSTKLGEIPEHKWTRPPAEFQVTAFYPLEPYREPEKQRGRFKRLFRR